MTETSGRLCFLDNLRAIIIVLVVLGHASISYMLNAPAWWYVVDPSSRSLLHSILVGVNDAQLMPIMFFVAGFFAWPSLQRKGALLFMQDKFYRLGLPWILGIVFLAPLTSFVARVAHQDPVGFWKFVTHDFWTLHFEQSVYWFLFMLLAFCMALALTFRMMSPGLRARPARTGRPAAWHFTLLIAAYSAVSLLISLEMNAWLQVPLAQALDWYSARVFPFVFQPPRLPIYVGYFILGIHAWQRNWLRPGGYAPRVRPWVIGYGLAILVYLFFRQRLQGAQPEHMVRVLAFTCIAYNLLCFTALMAGLAAFQRYWNGAGPFWRALSANSFGIYFVHPLAVYPLALALTGLAWPAMPKSLIVFLLALGWSWIFSACVLRRVPLLRRIF